jgi:hypothetical protein
MGYKSGWVKGGASVKALKRRSLKQSLKWDRMKRLIAKWNHEKP